MLMCPPIAPAQAATALWCVTFCNGRQGDACAGSRFSLRRPFCDLLRIPLLLQALRPVFSPSLDILPLALQTEMSAAAALPSVFPEGATELPPSQPAQPWAPAADQWSLQGPSPYFPGNTLRWALLLTARQCLFTDPLATPRSSFPLFRLNIFSFLHYFYLGSIPAL